MGVVYDLFGTGKTAVKMSLGKYLEGAGVNGTYNNSYVPDGAWLLPLTILTPRFVKITAEIDF